MNYDNILEDQLLTLDPAMFKFTKEKKEKITL